MPPLKDIDSEEQLKQMNAYEDMLDVFIHILILRVPSIFVLVNMTLMIWLVQTIYSNYGTETVPRSLYFFMPFLAGQPLIDIKIVQSANCDNGFEQVILKTFPTIHNQSINHNNLTKWKNSTILCQKISQLPVNFSSQCSQTQIYCSGICVNSTLQCPITRIRQIYYTQVLNPNQTLIYTSQDKMYRYIISRENKPTFVVGVRAQYQYQCANQYHYFDTYDNFKQYWNAAKFCGTEGFLSSEIYSPFDMMNTADFLFQNGIWSQSINATTRNSVTQLGSIYRLSFKKNKAQCKNAEIQAKNIQSDLLNTDRRPQFSKILLIMSFILFTICWAWLITFYCCCEHKALQKNIVVILLAMVQFIVIAFVYGQNIKLMQTQLKINQIASCIENPMSAFQSWTFNINSRSPLISIMYACVCFLLLQIVSYFINFCLYEPYTSPDISNNNMILNQLSYRHAIEREE